MRITFVNPSVRQHVQQKADPMHPLAAAASGGADTRAVGSVGQSQAKDDVASAHSTAYSALRNERFGSMLSQLTEPVVSESVALMRSDGASVDHKTALSRYAENSD